MSPERMAEKCQEQIDLSGEGAGVLFKMPGRWGKLDTRRLCKGGPTGNIVVEMDRKTIGVMFSAREVLDFITRKAG